MKLAVLITVGFSAMANAAQAFAYCTESRMPKYDVPVYLVNAGTTFVGVPTNQVMHDLRVAIDTWSENSGAKFRPYFAGKTTDTGIVAGTVQIRESGNCDKCESFACEKTTAAPMGLLQWGRASIVYLLSPSCRGGTQYTRHTNRTDSLDALFTHEIGHSWGLDDEYDNKCDGAWASAMAANCPNGRFITRRDISALASLYGRRQLRYETRMSTDGGLSWQDGTSESSLLSTMTRQTSLGTLASHPTREVLAHPSLGHTSESLPYPYTFSESGTTGGTFSRYVPWSNSSAHSWDAAGAAMKSSTQWAIGYRSHEKELDCEKGVVISSRISAGNTQNRDAKVSDTESFRSFTEGVSIAYDPAANVYVAAFSTNTYSLAFFLVDPDTGNRIGYKVLPGFKSYSVPAVACNTNAFAGEYNCLVAWRAPSGYDPIQYVRVKFNRTDDFWSDFVTPAAPTPSQLTINTTTPPSVTSYPDAEIPFILGAKEVGRYSTWRYSTTYNGFINRRTAVDFAGGSILSGALGVQQGRIIVRYAKF